MSEQIVEKNGIRHQRGTSEEELREALQRIHRVATRQTSESYMSIPADPARDADLLIGGAIDELMDMRAALRLCEKALAPFHGLTSQEIDELGIEGTVRGDIRAALAAIRVMGVGT